MDLKMLFEVSRLSDLDGNASDSGYWVVVRWPGLMALVGRMQWEGSIEVVCGAAASCKSNMVSRLIFLRALACNRT